MHLAVRLSNWNLVRLEDVICKAVEEELLRYYLGFWGIAAVLVVGNLLIVTNGTLRLQYHHCLIMHGSWMYITLYEFHFEMPGDCLGDIPT